MSELRFWPARRAPRLLAVVALLSLALSSLTAPARAQHDGPLGNAPPPPPGDGRLTVQVRHPSEPAETVGLPIVLYALSRDGTPGLARSETGPDGRAVFTDISTDPGIVYLIGARYREIPFGERVTFAAGQTSIGVEIAVASPTDRIEGVRVEEIRAQISWRGDRLVVEERLRLANPGDRVILLDRPEDPRALVVRPLPANATQLDAGSTAIGDGILLRDGAMHFRGPLYPGEQQIDYRYSLPVAAGVRRVELPIELREAAGRVVLVAGTPGIEIEGEGLVPSTELRSDDAQPLDSWARAELKSGERLAVALTLPASRRDPALVSLPRADVWLEMDDTWLTASVDLQLEVADGGPVTGTPDEPLLHLPIPEGAELSGVAPEVERLGLQPREGGGLDLVGPLAPGPIRLGYSYRMPAGPKGAELDMEFPRPVGTLNVLIADTGLALDSRRLHRRRPFRSGTRNYLHREAYDVAADERVDLSLTPLRGAGLPRNASIGLTLAAAVAAALFLTAPLRSPGRARARSLPELTPIQAEREALYAHIADLDHDFETGKLDQADHQQMREVLRARAIELLRAERAEAEGGASREAGSAARAPDPAAHPAPPAATTAAAAAPPERGAGRDAAAPLGQFCPACGSRIDPAWRFCSSCGGSLHPGVREERG